MTSRRRLRLLIVLLLPLLAVRALLPDGYMLATGSGQLRMVLCDAGLTGWRSPAPADQQHDPHQHHDSHQHHDQNQHDDGDDSPTVGENCPFALAAVHAPAPHLLTGVATPAPEFRFLSRYADQLPPATGPPRQASARAPPVSARTTLV